MSKTKSSAGKEKETVAYVVLVAPDVCGVESCVSSSGLWRLLGRAYFAVPFVSPF